MKIVNNTYRDITASESTIQKTPISELVETESLPDGSLMHIVVNGENGQESKKMTTDKFKQKIYESVQNTLKTGYWDTHELKDNGEPSEKHDQKEDPNNDRPRGTSFADLVNYLKYRDEHKEAGDTSKYTPDEVSQNDANGFINHLYFDFDVLKRYMVLKDGDLQDEIDDLNATTDCLDCYFSPRMKFHYDILDNNNEVQNAQGSNSVDSGTTENDLHCQMQITPGNKISSTWPVPTTGNLVVYGWLDSSQCLNNKATPDAYCALEGKINGKWTVVAVCPVTPAKNMTYVGFNLLVKEGLVLRARTGFVCGGKSGQHPNEQDGYDSLSNSTPNGFRCMVCTNEKGLTT